MKLRTKLTLLFSVLVTSILLASSIAVYYFSADFRQKEYFLRLHTRMNDVLTILNREDADSLSKETFSDKSLGFTNVQIVLYNYLNEPVFKSKPDSQRVFPVAYLNHIRTHNEAELSTPAYEAYGVMYKSSYGRYVVVISGFDVYGNRKLVYLGRALVGISGFMLLLSLLAGWIIAGQALLPIGKVVRQMESISLGNLHLRIDEGNGKDEIAQLAKTFNRMLERLEAAFEMQRSFFSNASHELRTPLTTMRAQIEITLMKERDNEEYKQILASVDEEIKSMTELSNGLLELASASVDITNIRQTDVRIDELLWQARSDLQKLYPGHEVYIEFEDMPDEESSLMVHGNEQLLKTALMNLIRNGCKFSIMQEVRVTLSVHPAQVEIHVIDNGIGIAPEEIALVLQPFYRASNARHIKGHGLGLPMANRIFQMHKGSMSISSTPGEGTDIRILLPNLNNTVV